jgi:uncharacterized RDD family membrane protein YckC
MTDEQIRKPKPVFDAFKSRLFASLFLVLITSVVMIPGMTTYLPLNTIDTIAIPILLFPFIWVGLFIYCYLAKKAWQVWAVLLGLIAIHIALSVLALR